MVSNQLDVDPQVWIWTTEPNKSCIEAGDLLYIGTYLVKSAKLQNPAARWLKLGVKDAASFLI